MSSSLRDLSLIEEIEAHLPVPRDNEHVVLMLNDGVIGVYSERFKTAQAIIEYARRRGYYRQENIAYKTGDGRWVFFHASCHVIDREAT